MGITTKTGLNENGQPSEVMLGCAIGDIIPHMGTTAPPGTLVCDGSEVSREVYHELYQEIGSLVGQGDGSTTFNLPDLRGKWMMGADEERRAGTEIAEGLPNITGAIGLRKIESNVNQGNISVALGANNAFTATPSVSEWTFDDKLGNAGTFPSYKADDVSFNASRASSVYGASQHVTPESVAVLPCIVYE